MKANDSMASRVEEYLQYRRALGYKLHIEGGMLRGFARFADGSGHHGPVTCELAIRWARLPANADRLYWARRIEVLIGFTRYCHSFDPLTEIPPRHVFGSAHRRRPPYLYSPKQLGELALEGPETDSYAGFRKLTHATLFGLLACTGLRISEALALLIEDVDLKRGLIVVRESKCRHSRLIPVHPTAKARLVKYAAKRHQKYPHASWFFVSGSGRNLPYSTVRSVFRDLTLELGWCRDGVRPRLHDLRHTFACRVLQKWQRGPSSHEERIDWLSRYLGHENVSDTYWYLTATPELLATAMARFKPQSGA
ncbi:MAG: tyrosine-type recombinase/integrase [Verrucomicrobiae bacterium]|nr:tyrosine-type recombinase/integrase [Verrucomicrobiae bacterium]MCP5532334.1 tyrosine-type recombinase/integrase [Akkermansiaceae bacterium]